MKIQHNYQKQIKRKFSKFQFMIQDIQEIGGFEELRPITFGRYDASIKITLIMNPNQENSHSIFQEAYDLHLESEGNIQLLLLFFIEASETDDTGKIIVENILTLNQKDSEKAREALIDWQINRLNFSEWLQKWHAKSPDLRVYRLMQNQYFWCLKNEIHTTPVKIINESLFPEWFEMSEIKNLILEIENEKTPQLKAV
jgi:hypothetical protein